MKKLLVAFFCLLPTLALADVSTLDAAVRAACPQIDGVSADGTIFFQGGASAGCRTAANAVMAGKAAYLAVVPNTITLTSSGTPSLNGTYLVDVATQQKIQAISIYVAVNGHFPNNAPSQAWPDASGSIHLFPNPSSWLAFATAVGDFVTASSLGQNPSSALTIP